MDQKFYTKPTDIVNKLNIHFSNIGKQTSTKKSNPLGFTDNLKMLVIAFCCFDVTETKVFNIINSLDLKKSVVRIVYL